MTKVVEHVGLTLNIHGPLHVDLMFGGIFVMIGDTDRIVPVGFKLSESEARALGMELINRADEMEHRRREGQAV